MCLQRTAGYFSAYRLFCIVVLLFFAGCSKEPQNTGGAPQAAPDREKQQAGAQTAPDAIPAQGMQVPPAGKEVNDKTTLLAAIADHEKPPSADPSSSLSLHPSVPAAFQVVFSDSGGGAAYTVEKNGKIYVVHNGRAGRHYASVGTVVLSPDGRRLAYGTLLDGKWRVVVDGKEGKSFAAVGTPMFSPDGGHVAYKAMLGERWFLVVDNTQNAGTRMHYLRQIFSGDSKKIAYVESTGDITAERMIVSDLAFNKRVVKESSGALLTVNADRTRIAAVSKEKGKQRVIAFSFDRPEAVDKGPLYDVIHNLAFGPDGVALSYDAERDGKHFLILNGKEAALPKDALKGPPVVRPDVKAVGVIIVSGNSAFLHQSFLKDTGKEKEYEEAADLVYNRDGSCYAYTARTEQSWFVVVNGEEGPKFDRVVSPIFSPDGKKLVYRARKDGKRFVVVADASGKVLRRHPAYEQVFPPVFTADGTSIAYGVKDGQKIIWKVEKLDD